MSPGQQPEPSLKFPGSELYFGYVATSPDYGPHWDSYLLHGVEAAFSKELRERLWITATGDYVRGTSFGIHQVSATMGPKFYVRTGRFRPYGTVQIGFAWQRSHGFYANDHHVPLPAGAVDIERGFTYRFGAGAEWQITHRVYWRIAQWDFQPQPWARHTPFYQNVGTGIGYRFSR